MENPAPIRTYEIAPIKKQVFFLIWALCILGFFAVIPYSLTLSGLTFDIQELISPKMIWSLIQNAMLYGLLIFTGLYIARRVGLGAPIFNGMVNKKDVGEDFRAMLVPALIVGILGGGLVILLDNYIFAAPLQAELELLGISLPKSVNPPVWQGLLASLYGGINEEVLLRLFVLTLIGGLIAIVFRKMDQKLPTGIFWTANILAAVLFGLGHLPTTAAIGLPLDFLVVTRAIVLNGLIGVGFGWLYWKYGLESAMLGHFTADIILHVLTPLAMMLLVSS
jgi:vacuolar-type H+-ATPase subunit I/STV1